MPDNADVAVVLNPQLSVVEFLATICEELHIDVPHNKGSVKALTDALNQHLLKAHAEGRRTILVVDEAQNLAPAVLEQVRLLTNLETAKQKLLQIILIGQPELRDLLARNDLRQLAQRITARYHLEPLSRDETAQLHRASPARLPEHSARFSTRAQREKSFACRRACHASSMSFATVHCLAPTAQESRRVNPRLIRRASAEVHGEFERSPWVRRTAIAAGIVGVAIIAASIWSVTQRETPVQPIVVAKEPAVESPAEPAPEAMAVETFARAGTRNRAHARRATADSRRRHQ